MFDNLTPGQNFFAGCEIAEPAWLPLGLHFLKQRLMDDATLTLLKGLGANVPRLDVNVAMMSGGQRRAIAVARSAMFAQKVVMLDEPTAALGQRESASGQEDATVAQYPAEMGALGVAALVAAIRGEPVQSLIDTGAGLVTK